MHSLDFRIAIIKKGEIVEAIPSKVILMMPKNQELSKFQRFKNQVSRIKIQE